MKCLTTVTDPNELVIAKCQGCGTEFGAQSEEDVRTFVRHCLRACDMYQMLGIASVCEVCHRYCMDDAALVKHRTSPSSSCPLPDPGSSAGPSAARTTQIEVLSDTDGRVRSPNHIPLVTIADNPVAPEPGRLDAVCYEYVPDAAAGDEVHVSGSCFEIKAAVCKGCHTKFSTLNAR
jgi:hypothetical protein